MPLKKNKRNIKIETNILAQDTRLVMVDSFVCFGSTLFKDVFLCFGNMVDFFVYLCNTLFKDVFLCFLNKSKDRKRQQIFGKLENRMWSVRDIIIKLPSQLGL